MIINKATTINSNVVFQNLYSLLGIKNAFLKYEGLNIAGSIKIKTAQYLIDGLEKHYNIDPSKNTIIESSSGNLGIALSIVCKIKNYKFICVTDPNTIPIAEKYMKAYGAQVIKVTERDTNGGFLAKRIDLIKSMLQQDANLVWTNQYASKFNIQAHYDTTAKEIFNKFPNLDYLFVGAGTTGTLVGCAKFFEKHSPKTKIIAIDTEGSVTFGFTPGRRYIPGIGTSLKPQICSMDNIYKVILIPEEKTIIMCNLLLRNHGLFLGGSSGTVLYAARKYINTLNQKNISLVAISPDFGDKYIDTIYNPDWVEANFGSTTKNKAFYE